MRERALGKSCAKKANNLIGLCRAKASVAGVKDKGLLLEIMNEIRKNEWIFYFTSLSVFERRTRATKDILAKKKEEICCKDMACSPGCTCGWNRHLISNMRWNFVVNIAGLLPLYWWKCTTIFKVSKVLKNTCPWWAKAEHRHLFEWRFLSYLVLPRASSLNHGAAESRRIHLLGLI